MNLIHVFFKSNESGFPPGDSITNQPIDLINVVE